MSEIIVEEFDTKAYPDYAMFGTYKSQPKTVDFTKDGIKLTEVPPNRKDPKFKYHIMVPFVEMEELFYCTNKTTNLLFIKPTFVSNLKIQESMYLGKESTNGLKFDVKSSDNRENYLIIVLKEKMSEKFLKTITQCSKSVNSSLKVTPIEIEFGKHLLQISKCPKISSTVEQKVQIIKNNVNTALKVFPIESTTNEAQKRPNPSELNSVKKVRINSEVCATNLRKNIEILDIGSDDEDLSTFCERISSLCDSDQHKKCLQN